MPDILAINSTITAIKHSIDIAKAIKDADSTLEKAELKLKIAELIESLAEAKVQVTEIKDLIQEKDKRIKELENSLENKSKLVRHKGRYFESDENGKPVGDPYCSHCWESKNKMIHLTDWAGLETCPSCSNVYDV